MPRMTIRLYLRLSVTTDESTSLTRQEEAGRAEAARRWPGVPVVVYADDGVSGGLDPEKRPQCRRLMAEWQPGDIVIVHKLDRLARSLFGFSDIVRAAEKQGVAIIAILDQFDLSTPAGRLQANMLMLVAEWERENIKTRVRNAQRHMRKVGRWTGGRPPYGLKPAPHPDGVGKTLVRDEKAAEVVREIVRRVIAEESPAAIAADLQARGIPSPRMHNSGKEKPRAAAWSYNSVLTVLNHVSIVGHSLDPLTKRLMRDDRGLPAVLWEPIVSAEDREIALASLKPAQPRKAAAGRHWLYSVAQCGDCTGNMGRSNGGTKLPGVLLLKCAGTRANPHTALTVRADRLSEHVNDDVVRRLGGTWATDRVFVPGSDPTAEIAQLRAFLAELEDDRKAGMFATAEGKQRYRQRYAETLREIEELEALPVSEAGWRNVRTGERFAARWERWSEAERGEWLRDVGAVVTVMRPPARTKSTPLAERVRIDLGDLEEAADWLEGSMDPEEALVTL